MLAGLVGYGAWTAVSLRGHLQAANVEAHRLREALLDRDRPTAQRSFAALAQQLDGARARADSVPWRLVGTLPGLGDDARAVRTVADTGAGLTQGPLRRMVDGGDWRLADRLTPHHGRVDLAALQALAPTVHAVAGNFRQAEAQLAGVRTDHLLGSLRSSFQSLDAQVGQASDALGAADRALRVLPAALGADGPRTWLLAFNNNAEIRATGGIPSALALIRADHGRIDMIKQVSSADFSTFPKPVLPQTRAERAIYDVQPTEYVQDTNFTPEFPRTAQLLRAMWQRRFGQRVDGVLSVDAVTLAYLLRATGPVDVDGTQLTAANATGELLNGVYDRLPTNAQQDAFFKDVARKVFQTTTAGVGSPRLLLSAFSQGVEEGRIYVHSFHAPVQRVLDPTAIAGNVNAAPGPHPQLGVYLDDATGAKMSYYLRTQLRVASTRCSRGRQTLAASMVLRSTAPRDAARLPSYITGGAAFGTDRGHQLVLARIYGPVGGKLSSFRFGKQNVTVPSIDDRGRPVATAVVDLAPGQATRMTWQVTTGHHQVASTQISQGPGMTARPARTTIPSACR